MLTNGAVIVSGNGWARQQMSCCAWFVCEIDELWKRTDCTGSEREDIPSPLLR